MKEPESCVKSNTRYTHNKCKYKRIKKLSGNNQETCISEEKGEERKPEAVVKMNWSTESANSTNFPLLLKIFIRNRNKLDNISKNIMSLMGRRKLNKRENLGHTSWFILDLPPTTSIPPLCVSKTCALHVDKLADNMPRYVDLC